MSKWGSVYEELRAPLDGKVGSEIGDLYTTPAGDLLTHVAGIVNGARNKTHGDKERSFVGIAKAWKRLFDYPFKGSDVARAMVALKEQRIRHGEQNIQSLKEHVEDICGYWAIYYELRAKEMGEKEYTPGPAWFLGQT